MLTLSVASTAILYQFVLRQERLTLIDREITSIATILLNSDLINLTSIDFTGVEDIISQQLSEERFGKFFVLRNNKGVVLYKSIAAQLLGIDDTTPSSEMWTTVTRGDHHIRILTVALPSVPDRKLQVGHVIDASILSFGDLMSLDKLLFLVFIFIVGITISWFLTVKLLEPLTQFSKYIGQLAENKDGKLELPPLPESLAKLMGTESQRDDFKGLVSSFDKLIVRVNKGFKLTRFWSYQMAHELKTPMAVIEATISKAIRSDKIDKATADKIITEVLDVSETISSFLNWAEVESSLAPPTAHVNKIQRTVQTVVNRLNLKYNDRIEIFCHNDFSVYANQQQLELVCCNLITNACKYSTQTVRIDICNRELKIIDSGKAISDKVLEHLGEPFNACETSGGKSSGLGLAYVCAICRMYGWGFRILPSESGNIVSLQFMDLDMEVAPSTQDRAKSAKMGRLDIGAV